jgi:hypothetical protein
MPEKLGFEELVENTITCSRETQVMSLDKFVLGIVLGLYIGFPRLNQLRFIARDPMLTGILSEPWLPPQSTLCRHSSSAKDSGRISELVGYPIHQLVS